jgi:hypothetical protein
LKKMSTRAPAVCDPEPSHRLLLSFPVLYSASTPTERSRNPAGAMDETTRAPVVLAVQSRLRSIQSSCTRLRALAGGDISAGRKRSRRCHRPRQPINRPGRRASGNTTTTPNSIESWNESFPPLSPPFPSYSPLHLVFPKLGAAATVESELQFIPL